MWRLYFQLSPEGKKRYFDEIVPRLHDAKVEVLGDREDEAWVLAYLGTKPNSRGRGYAARLLQDMMARVSCLSPFSLSHPFFSPTLPTSPPQPPQESRPADEPP
jgi:GNAT superfamily N-acetyltransferase